MADIPKPTGAYADWLGDDCLPEDKRGKPERNNREWAMEIWSNPWMVDHARKIFEAGMRAGRTETEL